MYIEDISRRRGDNEFYFRWVKYIYIFLTRENKIHVFKPPCYFLFII